MPWPVLLMAREISHGGSERQMTEIAKSLDRSRFEPHVGCFIREPRRAEELERAGVPVVQFPVHSYMSAAAVRGAFEIARYVRRNRIRIIHTWDYPLNAYGIPVARLMTGAVALASQRGHRELTPGIYKHLQHLSDKLMHGIVVNCEFLRRHLEQEEGVPAGRIRLCYNGIDLTQFHPSVEPRPERLRDASLVIGTVCVLRPEKNLPILIEAFARVRGRRAGMKLVVVGSGSMLETLQSLAAQLDIRADCIFEPATPRVPDWLRAIDIFVLPSRTEAFSNSIMEAMACGTAVIASDAGGNPELVRESETGLLFQSGDVAGLMEALAKLILDEQLRRRLAETGREMIHTGFSNIASARRMADIYEEFIARK